MNHDNEPLHKYFFEIELIGLWMRRKYGICRNVAKMITNAWIPPVPDFISDISIPTALKYNPINMNNTNNTFEFTHSHVYSRNVTWQILNDVIYLIVDYVLFRDLVSNTTLRMIDRGNFYQNVCCFCENIHDGLTYNMLHLESGIKYNVCDRCANWHETETNEYKIV